MFFIASTSYSLINDECDTREFRGEKVYYGKYAPAQFSANQSVIMPAAWKQYILTDSPVYDIKGKIVHEAKYRYSGICMLDSNGKMVPYRPTTKRTFYFKIHTSVIKQLDGIKQSVKVRKMETTYSSPNRTKYKPTEIYQNGKPIKK